MDCCELEALISEEAFKVRFRGIVTPASCRHNELEPGGFYIGNTAAATATAATASLRPTNNNNNNNSSTSDHTAHWVAFCITEQRDEAWYFDAFGLPPLEYHAALAPFKQLHYNDTQIQHFQSQLCGLFCIGYLRYFHATANMLHYIDLFSKTNTKHNDTILRRIILTNRHPTIIHRYNG